MDKKPEPVRDLHEWEEANKRLRQSWDVGTPEGTEDKREKTKPEAKRPSDRQQG